MIDVKRAIKLHGWTIARVAEEMGITQSALSQQINNKSITFAKAVQVANIIGCSISSLTDEDPTDFASFIRYKGIHYTADSLDEFFKQVDEIKEIAK